MSGTNESQFWMVWCPRGHAPTIQHWSRQDAQREARRLASLNPTQSFFVLKAVSRVAAMNVSEVDLHPPQHCDEPPF